MRLIANWILSAFALLIVAHLVPGFVVSGFISALIAAAVIGFVNATLGVVMKVLTFPLTIVTLGIFWWVVNAMMLWVASIFVPGFVLRSFSAAFIGAILLALVNLFFDWLRKSAESER